MTIPIARLVATPLRGRRAAASLLAYVGNAYRVVRPQRGQVRQFMHAGIELLGSPAPEGTAEVLEVLSASLDAVGLNRAVLGLGDADLYRQLLTELGVEGEAARPDPRPARRAQPRRPGDGGRRGRGPRRRTAARRCCALPGLRGGAEVLDQARSSAGAAVERATQRLQADLRPAGRARRRRPRAARPRPAARPRLLHGRDRRDLRPGARPHPRRRRALRRPARPLRAADAGRRLRALPGAACTSPRWRRSGSRGRADDADGRGSDPRPPRRAAEARDPARGALGRDARRARRDRARHRRDAGRLALARLRRRTASPW